MPPYMFNRSADWQFIRSADWQRNTAAPPMVHLELWENWATDSQPSYAGPLYPPPTPAPADFSIPDRSRVKTNLMGLAYPSPTGVYGFGTGLVTPTGAIATIEGTPVDPSTPAAPFSSMYTPISELAAKIWGAVSQVPAAPAAFGLAQMWAYWPDWWAASTGGTIDHSAFQNVLTAVRGRYRVDGIAPCFEASCELWVQHFLYLDVYPHDGWCPPISPYNFPIGMGSGTNPDPLGHNRNRIWAKNFRFRKSVTPVVFTGGVGSTDTTSAFNYVGDPNMFVADGNVPIVGSPTAMQGFLGVMIFQTFNETPAQWQARTGFTFISSFAQQSASIDQTPASTDTDKL